MAITHNVKGTSYPSFKIGKGGPTIYQGGGSPSGGIDGDLWVEANGSSSALFMQIGGSWVNISLSFGGLTPTTDGFIVGNGTAFAVETGNVARHSLGLGTADSPTFASLTSTGSLTVSNGTLIRGSAGAATLFSDVGTNTITLGGGASTTVVAGNLQVNGTVTTVNSTTLTVNADAVVVNHNGSTSTSGGAGINVEGDTAAIVGWLRVNGTNTALLELKAPTGSNLTIATTAATQINLGAAVTGQTLRYDGTKFVNSKLAIDDLSNVVITSPVIDQALIYNGSNWVNGAGGGGSSTLSGLSDVTITSVASGNILYYNGTKWVNSAPGSVAGVQPYNANLNTISGLSQGTNNVLVSNGSSWTSAVLSGSQVTAGYTGTSYTGTSTAGIATSLSGIDAALTTINTNVGNKQPLDANLTTIAGLTPAANAFILGNGSQWTTAYSDAAAHAMGLGTGDTPQFQGQTYANGTFASPGDAQARNQILRATTASNSVTEMFLGGVFNSRMILSNNSTWFFDIEIIARRTDANGERAAFRIQGCIDRAGSAGSTVIVGDLDVLAIQDSTPWTVTVDANTSSGSLRVRVQGESGKNIRWVGLAKTIEVTN